MEQTNRIRLRKLQAADVALMQRWLYQDHAARWYEQPLDWLAELENRDGAYDWIHHFIAEYAGAAVGFGQYYEYAKGGETWQGDIDRAGAYSIDYLLGEPSCLGRGLGKELILALIAEIAGQSQARRIIVRPEAENQSSAAALLSAGFVFDAANRLYRLELQ